MDTPAHFIEQIIQEDLAAGRLTGGIATRFPPEPNGYLHIGHYKAMCVSHDMARKYGGRFNLRFDDTNPAKEETEFVEQIQRDIAWMGMAWDNLFFGSDYFDACYDLAVKLIRKGLAYVCELSQTQMREYRGTLTQPGRNSPWRERAVAENLTIFESMRAGELPDGACVLRAKIDMASPNINLRDPAIYRILHRAHHHTGDRWCIYPMYDFAHPIQDALEGITHSLCSMEYEAHRPLYDWVVEHCDFEHKPRQIEFARLNMTRTVMSKRLLRDFFVRSGVVEGWDDPRMPTLAGMRRRGFPPAAIHQFILRNGVSKTDSIVDYAFLEHCVREELENTATRVMAVLRPLRVHILNWQDTPAPLPLENHPAHPEMGAREIPFEQDLYIDQGDFALVPPPKYHRLTVGGEVRLKGAYILQCQDVEQDADGNVTQVNCIVDWASRSGLPGAARKVKGTIQWLPQSQAQAAVAHLYEPLLAEEGKAADSVQAGYTETIMDAPADDDICDASGLTLNPNSLIICHALVEPCVSAAPPGTRFQFMREGYFVVDEAPVENALRLNRIVEMKSSYKIP